MDREKISLLIRQSAEGDEEAFEELLREIVPILYGDVSRYIKERSDIDDVIQESIWKIWSSIDKVDVRHEPMAYFRKVTYNTLISYLRKRKKKEVYIPYDEFLSVVDERESGEDSRSAADIEVMKNLLDKLPDRYKRVIELRYLENKSYDEIGAILNIKPAAARQLVSRAIKKLKKLAGDKK